MIVRELITSIGFKVDATQLEQANRRVGRFKSKAQSMTGNLRDSARAIRNLGAGMTAALTLPIVGLGIAAVKSAGNIEMLRADFETLLGSAEKSFAMVERIREMAKTTPYGTEDLARGTKTLLSFGVTADRVIPTMKMLGDVALGNKQRMASLALVFGQVQAAGKLTGQDLLQFVNAGFNPLQQIAAETGETMNSLRERMSKGEISVDAVRRAFQRATSEGGMFYKGMERGSKTLQGRLSTLKDAFTELAVEFGEILLPGVKRLTIGLTALADRMKTIPAPVKKGILIFGGLVAAIGPVLLVFGQLASSVIAIKGLMAAFGVTLAGVAVAAGPVVAVGAALAWAGVLIYQSWEPLMDFFDNLSDKIGSTFTFVKKWAGFLDQEFGFKSTATGYMFNTTGYTQKELGQMARAKMYRARNATSGYSQMENMQRSNTPRGGEININVKSDIKTDSGEVVQNKEFLSQVASNAIKGELESVIRQAGTNFQVAGAQ